MYVALPEIKIVSGIQSGSDRSPSDSNRPPLKIQNKHRSEGGRRGEGGDGGDGDGGEGSEAGEAGEAGEGGEDTSGE